MNKKKEYFIKESPNWIHIIGLYIPSIIFLILAGICLIICSMIPVLNIVLISNLVKKEPNLTIKKKIYIEEEK